MAGFTPAVLFLGPVNGTIEGAWLREQAQFLGVGIYLAIDNLIAPFRSDKTLRLGASLPVTCAVNPLRLLITHVHTPVPCAGFVAGTETARTLVAETRAALVALVGDGDGAVTAAHHHPAHPPSHHSPGRATVNGLDPGHGPAVLFPLDMLACAARLDAADAAVARLAALVTAQVPFLCLSSPLSPTYLTIPRCSVAFECRRPV